MLSFENDTGRRRHTVYYLPKVLVSRGVNSPIKIVSPSLMWLTALLYMVTLKLHSYPPLCSSVSHKYNNYTKAPYIVSSYPQSLQANLFTDDSVPPSQTNSPRLHRHNQWTLVHLNCIFQKSLTNS